MSKRRKEIQKKKKLARETSGDPADPSRGEGAGGFPDEGVLSEREVAEPRAPDPSREGDQIVSGRRPEPGRSSAGTKPGGARVEVVEQGAGQGKEILLLCLLILYVLILGLGTAGELFEIQWILDLPVFK